MSKRGYPDEYPITLVINGYEVAVFQLTNQDLEDWAYGYLFSEGFIDHAEDIRSVAVDEDCAVIRVTLSGEVDVKKKLAKKKHYTAGCGRGITFFSMTDVKEFQRVESNKTYKLSYLLKKRSEFAGNTPLYLETGGVHGACIVDASGSLIVREDIGRHNAMDKVIGYAVRKELNPEGLLLLTTGRISYEMLAKAAKFGFSVIGSSTVATRQAVQLAKFLNIEVIGYLKGKRAILYTSLGRVVNDISDIQPAAQPVKNDKA